MRILITGGTGFIGRALCKALLAKGHELTVLSRKPESVQAKCGAQVNAIASLDDWEASQNFEAVINLAGEPIVDVPWTNQRKKILWDSRVTLTRQLIESIKRAEHKPEVLLSCSAIGYYGDRGDQILDESARAATTDFSAKLCTAWESAANTATDFNVRVCLLRFAPVLAPSGGMLGRMLPPFKLGLGARIGSGQQWMSWIHVDDCIAIVLRLLEDTEAAGSYNVTAPQPVTNQKFTSSLAATLRRPALFVAPAWLMKLALQERACLLLGSQRVVPAKLEAMGYHFMYPELDGALKALLA